MDDTQTTFKDTCRQKQACNRGAEAEDEDQSEEDADVETQAVNKYATMQ